MFCSCSLSSTLNHRTLGLIYDYHASSFEDIFGMTDEKTIRYKNLEHQGK